MSSNKLWDYYMSCHLSKTLSSKTQRNADLVVDSTRVEWVQSGKLSIIICRTKPECATCIQMKAVDEYILFVLLLKSSFSCIQNLFGPTNTNVGCIWHAMNSQTRARRRNNVEIVCRERRVLLQADSLQNIETTIGSLGSVSNPMSRDKKYIYI